MGNLSIGGVCIRGRSSLQEGDVCDFELHDNGPCASWIVKGRARVIRTEIDQLALEFVDVDVASYMFLQTMVLYCADDPLAVAAEFQTDFSCPAVSASC